MKITILFSLIVLLSACSGSDGPLIDLNKDKTEVIEEDTLQVDFEEIENEVQQEQTKEERIAEIKMLYADLQQVEKEGANTCQKWSKKYKNKDIVEDMEFEFENKAQLCRLDNGYAYRKVEENGYEWGSETTFYYQNDALFFVFVTGASEGWAYEQRIYYDKEGEVIRILEDENDYDGATPTNRKDVTRVSRGGEILNDVKGTSSEFDNIRKGKG